MTPYGLLLELAVAAIIAAVFNRYCVYRPAARTAAAWRLFWRGAAASAALCTLGAIVSISAPARPLLLVGLGIDLIAGLVGLFVMVAASIRALRHGVHRRHPRLGGEYR